MALKLNKVLNTKSGFVLPINNVITSKLYSPFVSVVEKDGGGVEYIRMLTYDLRNYIADADVIKVGDNFVQGGVEEFGAGYEKILTPAEYTALLGDGSLAEVWLKDYIDGIMGAGTCTIFDPYV